MVKISNTKAFRIVVSILIAVGIWLYVDMENGSEVTTWVRDVPVEFTSENTTLADNGLMLLSGYDTTIDLLLKAPRKELIKLDRSQVRIEADVGGIKETGVQTLTYQVCYPDNIARNAIQVEKASAYTITVTVGELHTKTVPLECTVLGQPAKGFSVGEVQTDPEEIVLRGQRDDLLNVSYAKVELSVADAEKTLVQAVEFTLYDYNDVPIENENIRAGDKLVQVTVPITTAKEVPLRIQFEEATGSTLDQVEYSISPSKVKLSGEKATLDAISEIVLDTIYLQDLQESQTLSYEIPLPKGVTLPEDAKTASVTIVVTGVSEKTLTVDQISCIKVPSGYTAQLQSASLDVTLRGLSRELEDLTADDIRIVADLSGVTEEGLKTVPAAVEISGSKNVGTKGSYQVIVNVSKTETDN